MNETDPKPPRRGIALYVALPLALLICWGAYLHWRQTSEAVETLHASENFVLDVHVATATLTSEDVARTLPGQTAAFDEADLFARATGFIAERRVDIGSRVRKGDLLIRIAAPDLDAQLTQARAQLGQLEAALAQANATLQQAQANTRLAGVNKFRATTLASEGWGTRENADTQSTNSSVSKTSVSAAQAGIGVAVANIRAQRATIDRLVSLTGFERVTAPFDGTITARDVDVGALVQSDTSSGTPLFHIAREDVLRCQVYVPQSDFAGIRPGLRADVTVPELSSRTFQATVSRTSASLTQNARTMLVEVDIANPDGLLAPGLFVNVAFKVAHARPVVVVPDAALIFDAAGLHVAVASADGRVHMTPIVIAHDFGEKAELREGLRGGESLVVNPPSDLAEQQRIHVVKS